MIESPTWSKDELETERQKAIANFRKVRVEEPLEQYLTAFDKYHGVLEELLESTVDLTDLDSRLADILQNAEQLEAFRYLAGPPISVDDLKIIAEAVLTSTRLSKDPDMVARVAQVILSGLDRRRFPWVSDAREPTEAERTAAAISSAALLATQKVQTDRRTVGKREQEAMVVGALTGAGYRQADPRVIRVLQDAPAPGHFCGESMLGERKADIIVGTWDRRVMAIECILCSPHAFDQPRRHSLLGHAERRVDLARADRQVA
jgi:hypothetical protein